MQPLQDALSFGQVELEILIYTIVAMLLGAAVGFERERAAKAAGLRTHALVSGAACLLVSLGLLLTTEFADVLPPGVLRADPLGVIESVVTGVSFLGAGTIIRGGDSTHIEGLTTAAAILFTAALGMTVASGRLVLAALLTLVVVAALRVPSGFARPRHASDRAPDA
jgi:putative Mg2+ transporter-C (MgtC) family protein